MTVEKEGMRFSVESEIAEVVDYFEIDYNSGWLRKGFVVYLNGSRSSC